MCLLRTINRASVEILPKGRLVIVVDVQGEKVVEERVWEREARVSGGQMADGGGGVRVPLKAG